MSLFTAQLSWSALIIISGGLIENLGMRNITSGLFEGVKKISELNPNCKYEIRDKAAHNIPPLFAERYKINFLYNKKLYKGEIVMKYYIGIDLGGTNIKAGVVNENFEIIGKATTIERPHRNFIWFRHRYQSLQRSYR